MIETTVLNGKPEKPGFYFYRDRQCNPNEVLILQVQPVRDKSLGLYGTTVDYRPGVFNRNFHHPVKSLTGIWAEIPLPPKGFLLAKIGLPTE